MKLAVRTQSQASATNTNRPAPRVALWKWVVAIGASSVLLHLSVQAKPIAGCFVQEADLLDPTACLSPPESLTSTRPTSRTSVANQPDQVARRTLENTDTGSGGTSNGSTGSVTDYAQCSALRGTHEAQSLMLQSVQQRLSQVERDRRAAKNTLKYLRRSGAEESQLSAAASRLTQINAVWSALRGDVETRTKSFNKSMAGLTRACLRG